MKQTLTKLVDMILQKLREQTEKPPSEAGLRTWLLRQGYKKRDIDAAMKLVGPRGRPAVVTSPGTPTPQPQWLARHYQRAVRQLSPYEACKLTVDARDALARLELYELVDAYDREAILDRLNQFEGEVGIDELDYVLSAVCLGRDVESQQTIYNVLENNRDAFN